MGSGQEEGLPITDIKQVLLARGRLKKEEILSLWGLDENQYEQLKQALEGERLITPGPRGAGGFVARFARSAIEVPDAEVPEPAFRLDHERRAALRLAELLSHTELEKLLGDLVYTIRRVRAQQTGRDRRGTKLELAVALLTRHGIDLFARSEVRRMVARRTKATAPGRWHAGKTAAVQFADATGFPAEYAGLPVEEAPSDFEYLEGRLDLHALQDFQLEVQRKLQAVLQHSGRRAIVTLPTGGGKTRVAVDTIRDWLTGRYRMSASGEGNTVLWLAHTEELCEQATQCFSEVWRGSSNVCPVMLFRFWGRFTRDLAEHRSTLSTLEQRPAVLVSTPQRLRNLIEGNLEGGAPILEALMRLVGLIVIDEAHRAAAPTYRQIIQHFDEARHVPAIIGLTATPFRHEYHADDPEAGTLELSLLFKTIIEPTETLGEDPRLALQEQRYLAQPIFGEIRTGTRLKAPEGIDLDHLTAETIERIDHALKLRADRPERRLIILEDMIRLCSNPNSLLLYFGPTVQDAECMAFLLRQRGIEAAFVSGETRSGSRRKIISDFRSGHIQVLCNCEVLTTGFDAPKVTHVIMARPTVSQVLYEQMVGRGLRGPKFGGTATCHIIDLEDQYRAERPQLGYRRFRELWGR